MKYVLACLLFLSLPAAYGQAVVITGIDKSHQRTLVWVNQSNGFFDASYGKSTAYESVYTNDSLFTITTAVLKQPTFASYNVYRGPGADCLLTPGDKITLTLSAAKKPLTLAFEGKNALNYQYWLDVEQVSTALHINKKLNAAKSWQAHQRVFGQYSLAIDSLIGKYAARGMSPLLRNAANATKTGMLAIRRTGSYYRQKTWADAPFPSPLVKSDTLNFQQLNQSALLGSQLYVVGLYNLIRLTDGNRAEHTIANFQGNAQFIRQHFTGPVRDYLVGMLVGDYANAENSELDKRTLQPLIARETALIQSPAYKAWATFNSEFYTKANEPMPAWVLQSKLLTADSTLLSVQ